MRYPCFPRPADPTVHPAELVVPQDFPTLPDETLVYRFYGPMDGDTCLLYVGITAQPVGRWMAHRRLAAWWPLIREMETEMCASRDAARDLEADFIYEIRPPFNVAGNPDRRAASWRG